MINLLPNEHREYIEYGRKNAQVLTWLSALVFGIVIVIGIAIVGRLTIQTAKNQSVEQKASIEAMISDSNLGTVEKEYSAFVNGLSSTRKVYENQILYSRLLNKIATLLPPGARLTNISLAETDRAINLDFDNQIDNLGPTIQVNLLNQGEQIAEEVRLLTTNGLKIPLGGMKTTDGSGAEVAKINIDTKTRQMEFYVNTKNNTDVETYKKALTNGGEFAYSLVSEILSSKGMLTESPSKPYIDSYSVDDNAKRVDFTFRAENINQARQLESDLIGAPYSIFVDTYVFENYNHTLSKDCTSTAKGSDCKTICATGGDTCADSAKRCVSTTANGCEYIIRAYYDELFTSAAMSTISSSEQTMCSTTGLPCTHKVSAKYNQLFEKVDINRVASCLASSDGSELSCPVEMRAEFGSNAKFYLINGSGS